MKTILILFMLGFLSLFGCSKKVADEQVTSKVAEALCGKMKECSTPTGLDGETCANTLKSSLLVPLEKNGKKGKVTAKELDACVKEIKSQDCSAFGGPNPPGSCAFFKG